VDSLKKKIKIKRNRTKVDLSSTLKYLGKILKIHSLRLVLFNKIEKNYLI